MITLLAMSAFAQTFEHAELVKVWGWTQDNAWVVEIKTHDFYANATLDGEIPGSTRKVCAIATHGEDSCWLLENELPAHLMAQSEPVQIREFGQFLAQNPLRKGLTEAEGLDGVEAEAKCPNAKDTATGWEIPYNAATPPSLTLAVSRLGKGTWIVDQYSLPMNVWQEELTATVSVEWSPDQRAVGFATGAPPVKALPGMVYNDLHLSAAAAAPLISVLVPAEFGEDALIRAVAAMDARGALQTGPAKSARPVSVVYFAPAWKAEAEALARTIPGGATVKPLTWEAPQHLVVALGDSAKPR